MLNKLQAPHCCSTHPHVLVFTNDATLQTFCACVAMCGPLNVHKSAHACVSLPRWMDGDVTVHLTICPPSAPTLCHPSLQPSLHSSFITPFTPPLQKLHLCKKYCRAETLRAKWSEVAPHYGSGYEKPSTGISAHLDSAGVVFKDKRGD